MNFVWVFYDVRISTKTSHADNVSLQHQSDRMLGVLNHYLWQ